MNPFRDSTDILHDRASLASRLSQDGYLFFPRLIPADDVRKLRKGMLKILENAGWLDTGAGYDLESAIGNSKSFVPDTDPAATAVMMLGAARITNKSIPCGLQWQLKSTNVS